MGIFGNPPTGVAIQITNPTTRTNIPTGVAIQITNPTTRTNISSYNTKVYSGGIYTGLLEGVTKNTKVSLLVKNDNSIVRSIHSDICNVKFTLLDLTKNYYLMYDDKVDYIDINKSITPDKIGYISGTVSTSSCGNNSFFIKCIRSDGFYIGVYSVNSTGNYTIDNLHCDKQYDIILVDSTLTLEAQIITKRSPTPYITTDNNVYFTQPFMITAEFIE